MGEKIILHVEISLELIETGGLKETKLWVEIPTCEVSPDIVRLIMHRAATKVEDIVRSQSE